MDSSDLITVDPDILGGTPVFKGTLVPVKTLFEYLEDNYTLDEFLECFPSVTREVACRALNVRSPPCLTVPPHENPAGRMRPVADAQGTSA